MVNYSNDNGYLPSYYGTNTESHPVKAEDQGRACVLALHRVTDRIERPHDVRWSTFRAIVEMVLRFGRKAETRLEPDAVRPASVIFTFDDGTSDHLDVAQELAAKELPGLFFLSTSTLDEPGYTGSSDARHIAEMGHVIGSHGVRHDPLHTYTHADLLKELRSSKESLEDLVQSEVRYFAPPGGSWAPSLGRSLRQCGYTASRSMRWGMHSARAPRWAVPVVPVTELTYSLGWISHALQRDRLPFAMRSVGFAKGLLRPRTRALVSRLAHRWW
jgi:peptidoglycan/xylan/chitin deacetylase (PgdA/CDA1 family)